MYVAVSILYRIPYIPSIIEYIYIYIYPIFASLRSDTDNNDNTDDNADDDSDNNNNNKNKDIILLDAPCLHSISCAILNSSRQKISIGSVHERALLDPRHGLSTHTHTHIYI